VAVAEARSDKGRVERRMKDLGAAISGQGFGRRRGQSTGKKQKNKQQNGERYLYCYAWIEEKLARNPIQHASSSERWEVIH
jgi:hypothetical protein